ncbi:leucine-rich repeats and immunoglobulin-like domains protein 2 protein [Lasius niger]|uniref:Leucine-rich repeats and immunoglobulin-like domains protein 2 protein n=1 Tax=Lasius niger TaxID=67767 RepID=A0A0J7L426_LASNI|nr:leucine-rich repeats and immunoglobulin-like domains protein 2 protein [Lasius niger]
MRAHGLLDVWRLVWLLCLVLATGLAQVSQVCPTHNDISPCYCSVKKSGLDIVCEITDMQHISKAMSVLKGRPNLVIFYLRLRHNNLPKLQGYVFLGLDIRHLTIHNSSLAVLEESSLSSIAIHNKAFEGLDTLEILTLYENKISSIEPDAFKGLDNRRLKRLNLGGNELARIPTQALNSLELLKKLELQENHISTIEEGDFEGLKALDSLGLAHNHLREVPARVFSHLTQLNSLELDGNQITHVDPNAFIGLEDNPLICDCDLRWYSTWLGNLRDKDDEMMSKKRTVCTMVSEHREYSVQNIPLDRMGCVGKNAGKYSSSATGCKMYVDATLPVFVLIAVLM